ncbi:hypothetical protein J6590_100745, partial [Homalodisca vitripennis]
CNLHKRELRLQFNGGSLPCRYTAVSYQSYYNLPTTPPTNPNPKTPKHTNTPTTPPNKQPNNPPKHPTNTNNTTTHTHPQKQPPTPNKPKPKNKQKTNNPPNLHKRELLTIQWRSLPCDTPRIDQSIQPVAQLATAALVLITKPQTQIKHQVVLGTQ